jgi:methylmalonyl-CoA/ethylmalonyl-CoA epimerase
MTSPAVTGLAHVGLIVPDISAARKYWTDTLGLPTTEPEALAPGLQISFVILPNTKIELIQPIDPETPQGKWLSENPQGGLNHIAFDTPDIANSISTVKSRGVTTDWTETKSLTNGTQIIFFDPASTGGALTEFCQAPG